MAETDIEAGTDRSGLLESLFDLCGKTQAGTLVARELVEKDGKNPLEEAGNAANRGVLSAAAEFLSVSELSPDKKIEKLNELAVLAQRHLQSQQEKGPLSPVATKEALKATAVFKATADLLRPAK